MEQHWEKQLTQQLLDIGLNWEKARLVVGIIAEQRQIADREGYRRGYNLGYSDGKRMARITSQ